MAITQDMLAEESFFSRAERSVARGIYRAFRFSEALKNLEACSEVLDKVEFTPANSRKGNRVTNTSTTHRAEIKTYLLNRIRDTLDQTKVPQTPQAQETKDSVSQAS